MSRPLQLTGKVVVVTGASRGLGEAIALSLARQGAHIVLAARDTGGLERVASAIRVAGGAATPVTTDLSTADGRTRLIASAERVGPVEVLVNNAGIEITVALTDQKPDEIDSQIAVNLAAPLHLTRAVIPRMLERRRGCVVMVSSMSGKGATPYNAVYAATKHGLVGFSSSVRLELAGSGVHVGVVCPGFVAGGMWGATGLHAPPSMREVSIEQVVAAVRKVIDGAPEVLVTRGPIRIGLALAALFPSFEARALRWMGVLSTLQARANRALKLRSP